MPIEFLCPSCSKQLRVPDAAAGKKAKCPSCEAICAIPVPASTPVAATPPFMTASPAIRESDHLKDTTYYSGPGSSASAANPTSTFGGIETDSARTPNPFASPQKAVDAPALTTGNFELASRGSRLLGRILDVVFGFLGGLAFAMLLGITMGALAQDEEAGAIFGMIGFYGGMFAVAVLNWFLIVKSGQSLGKKIMRTRIVMEDSGDLPGFVQGVLLRNIVFSILCSIPLLGLLLGLTDACWIFGEKQQCLHDLLAKTRVVVVS